MLSYTFSTSELSIILEIRMLNVRRQGEVHPLPKTVTVKEIISEIQV